MNISVFLHLLLVPVLYAQVSSYEPLLYSRDLSGDGRFIMRWTPLQDKIIIQIEVETLGYVGLGFSKSPMMKGADMVMTWVSDIGEVFLSDRFATGHSLPTEDVSQDYLLIHGRRNCSHTTVRFSRPWVTCDTEGDVPLSEETISVLWAYGKDSLQTLDSRPSYHQNRGAKSLILKKFKPPMNNYPDDVISVNFTTPPINIPDHLDTLYWCKIFKLPDFVLTSEHNMIGYRPVVRSPNSQVVHHIILHECPHPDGALDEWVDQEGFECYSRLSPPQLRKCSDVFIAWAIGSDGEMFLDDVGFPLGNAFDGSTYFKLEMHYDNPSLASNIIDDSGLQLLMVNRPVKYPAAILSTGVSVSMFHIIPPNKKEWPTVGHCSPECTEGLPQEGIKIFGGILHQHLLGRKMVVQHIREGQELKPLLQDMNYDFNFQQSRHFPEPVTVLPGDYLRTTCITDSSKVNVTTFGGISTHEEMCLAFLYYYPKISFNKCQSQPTLESILRSTMFDHSEEAILKGVKEFQKAINPARRKGRDVTQEITTPEATGFIIGDAWKLFPVFDSNNTQTSTMYDLFREDNFWTYVKTNMFQTTTTYSSITQECENLDRDESTLNALYNDFIPREEESTSNCVRSSRDG